MGPPVDHNEPVPPDEPPAFAPEVPQQPSLVIDNPDQYGFNEYQANKMAEILSSDPRFEGVMIDVRPTDPIANELLLHGEKIDETQYLEGPGGKPLEPGTLLPAQPKSELFKQKTANRLDLLLGARPEDRGKVWAPVPGVHLFPPTASDVTLTRNNPDAAPVWDRYYQRLQEHHDQAHQLGDLHMPFDQRTGHEHDWQMIDGERVRVRSFTDQFGVERMLQVKDQSGVVRDVAPSAFAGDKDLYAIRNADGSLLGARPRGEDGKFLTRAYMMPDGTMKGVAPNNMSDEQWHEYSSQRATKAAVLRTIRNDPSLHNMHADLLAWDTKDNATNEGIRNTIINSHLTTPGIRFQTGAPPTQWYAPGAPNG